MQKFPKVFFSCVFKYWKPVFKYSIFCGIVLFCFLCCVSMLNAQSMNDEYNKDFQETKNNRKERRDKEDKRERQKGKNSKKGKGHKILIPDSAKETENLSIILSRPTEDSITINILSKEDANGFIEYGLTQSKMNFKSEFIELVADQPFELNLKDLTKNSEYFYRANFKRKLDQQPVVFQICSFHTARMEGNSFCFNLIGDSHPERRKQNDPVLYAQTLLQAREDNPDFFLCMGDDFSVDTLDTVNSATVEERYRIQRPFLGLVGNSTPIFLVNGNHEQAALCNLNGTPDNVAVWAQNSRNRFYSQPAPDGFYSGDNEEVQLIGYLRDYYSWTWGNALFVVIDPYWHSEKAVDNVFGGGEKTRDMWNVTLGKKQYDWFKKTLEQSQAKFKFVFTHHVLGRGRGGIEQADLYEWGGNNRKGEWEFDRMRPGWEMPIHQLMVKNKVTILFQGHDHLFARQELDGIVYQELPEPGDPNYSSFNFEAYETGEKFPNSGYVRVNVSQNEVKVEYVRSFLPEDEDKLNRNKSVCYSYLIKK